MGMVLINSGNVSKQTYHGIQNFPCAFIMNIIMNTNLIL